jgi:hypothetical protein
MFPFEIPPGTTVRALVTDVIPRAHAELVPKSAGPETFRAVIAIDRGPSFTADVRAGAIDVREVEEKKVDFWITFDEPVAARFLADWSSTKALAPKFAPPGDVKLLTDPRVLKRLAMVSGKVEIALADFPGEDGPERVAMTIASGAAAKKTIDRDDPDVVVEATMSAFLRLLDGTLAPEEAIADNHVSVRGKRLVAMQFALALAPFFPQPSR